jgi:biopolymer transport protein ExbB
MQTSVVTIDLWEVLSASPLIYTVLFSMSVAALGIWLVTMSTLSVNKLMPKGFLPMISQKVLDEEFDEALKQCQLQSHLSAKVIEVGISARRHGLQAILELMRQEAQRCGASLWQRLSLLSDVATIAPMLGLLGTVIGMFYAFYDMNRTSESIAQVFDGLGVAVGTTVAGLIVAILAILLQSTLKFRLTRLLTAVENEAVSIAGLINQTANRAPEPPAGAPIPQADVLTEAL